jgi:hypothetical protein
MKALSSAWFGVVRGKCCASPKALQEVQSWSNATPNTPWYCTDGPASISKLLNDVDVPLLMATRWQSQPPQLPLCVQVASSLLQPYPQ